MSEVIVITSGKGGVGKTTTTANVGTGLAKEGKKVVLIDTDIGLRNLDVVMGLENRIVYNLVDVVEGNCRIKQALIRDKRHPGLYLMPSAQTRDKSSVTPQQMKKLTQEMRDALIFKLSRHGGHCGPNLGFAEATVALHYVFDSPVDKIVFDVSHQTYCHKMLTGRKDGFLYEEHFDDISGYSNPAESCLLYTSDAADD